MDIVDKYRIEHVDGTPLKGKKYFVLRLDSDDPIETARVFKAMKAYEENVRNCDVGTVEEQVERFYDYCKGKSCNGCAVNKMTDPFCVLRWANLECQKEDKKS